MKEPLMYIEQRRERSINKPLPSSDESERLVLGAILMDNSLILQVLGRLKPDDFYSASNRRVFSAMVELSINGKTIDPITIGEELKKDGNSIDTIGGVATIMNLTFGLFHFTDLSQYIEIIYEKSMARQLVRICGEISADALEEDHGLEELLENAEQKIFSLADGGQIESFVDLSELTSASVQRMELMSTLDTKIIGMQSGFTELDHLTLGWQDKDLIYMAGRPSMGKTALALDCAMNAGSDVVVPIFSLEMGKDQLINRMICNRAMVNSQAYRLGNLTAKEKSDVADAVSHLNESNIVIDDAAAITTAYMRFKLRRVVRKKKKKLGLIVIDYLQLMNGNERRNENRQQEITQISRELKTIAKEFDCPVIALSQLSRAPELRKPPKPFMSDLRESGSIEQDADVVVFIYREDYYRKSDEERDNLAEIIISKNRNGPTGSVFLRWEKKCTRFQNLVIDI